MPMLNYTISIVFCNLKNNDSHLIMLKFGRFNFKIYVIPNGVQKNMSFNINNKLSFIDTFQFLNCSLDILVKKLGKVSFKYLSQEFDTNELDLVKQKGFYPYEYINCFENLKKNCQAKKSFIVC